MPERDYIDRYQEAQDELAALGLDTDNTAGQKSLHSARSTYRSPNVEEATDQFWHMWYIGTVDDPDARQQWFELMPQNYQPPRFTPSLINASGQVCNGTTQGTGRDDVLRRPVLRPGQPPWRCLPSVRLTVTASQLYVCRLPTTWYAHRPSATAHHL